MAAQSAQYYNFQHGKTYIRRIRHIGLFFTDVMPVCRQKYNDKLNIGINYSGKIIDLYRECECNGLLNKTIVEMIVDAKSMSPFDESIMQIININPRISIYYSELVNISMALLKFILSFVDGNIINIYKSVCVSYDSISYAGLTSIASSKCKTIDTQNISHKPIVAHEEIKTRKRMELLEHIISDDSDDEGIYMPEISISSVLTKKIPYPILNEDSINKEVRVSVNWY
jgi:hypothetical protein